MGASYSFPFAGIDGSEAARVRVGPEGESDQPLEA
jgi:hypothetical protein